MTTICIDKGIKKKQFDSIKEKRMCSLVPTNQIK